MPGRNSRFVALWAAVLFAVNGSVANALPPNINAAVNDSNRPDADKARDAERKPDAMLAFSDLKIGAKVADLVPGGGYFTRLFAKAVGAHGHVYAFLPDELLKKHPTAGEGIKSIAADTSYSNVSVIEAPINAFKVPEPLDLAWTSQNYHDLHNWASAADLAAFNKAVFAALKPGGTYIVLDHAAAAAAPADVTATLHRIDPAIVKQEVLAAGFKFVAASEALRHPEDDHTAKVFDASVRGKTDQFVLKFRKPK